MAEWRRFVQTMKQPLKAGTWDYSISHVKQLHQNLGRPSDAYPIIHVTGTNGKGTIAYKMAKMLELSGYRTGLFLSPHLFSWRERVQINSELISKEKCISFLDQYQRMELNKSHTFSFFEFFTTLAYQHFKEQQVEVAVVEVGLGGRYDATNLIDKNLLAIITSISLDHTHILGDTTEKITQDKAGIIKPHCPVLIGPSVNQTVVNNIAQELNSPVFTSPKSDQDYDHENSLLLGKAREIISNKFTIPESVFQEVSSSHNLPCRLEDIPKFNIAQTGVKNLEFATLDVGHNPEALSKTLHRFKKLHPNKSFSILYGCKSKKDFVSNLKVLAEYSDNIHLVKTQEGAGLEPKEILNGVEAEKSLNKKIKLSGQGNVKETLQFVLQQDVQAQQVSQGILIIGSFKFMKEAKEFFGIKVPSDLEE